MLLFELHFQYAPSSVVLNEDASLIAAPDSLSHLYL